MSTVTTEGRSSIEGFRSALIRRFHEKRSDPECSTLAEELLEEVRQLPVNQYSCSYWTIKAGEEAMYMIRQGFWKEPKKNEKANDSFPKTRGVFFSAVLDGWEATLDHYGAIRDVQERFARFIARVARDWNEKERAAALLALRDKLKNINPPVGWDLLCNFLAIVEPDDDKEVLQTMGRSFGHLASRYQLALMATAIQCVSKGGRSTEALRVALPALVESGEGILQRAEVAIKFRGQLKETSPGDLYEARLSGTEIALTRRTYQDHDVTPEEEKTFSDLLDQDLVRATKLQKAVNWNTGEVVSLYHKVCSLDGKKDLLQIHRYLHLKRK